VQETSTPGASKDPKNWLSLLDRATEYKLCLLVLSIVLAADVAIVLATSHQQNLLSFNWSMPNPNLHPGTILIFVACYLLYMAAVSPILQLFAAIPIKLIHAGWERLSEELQPPSPPSRFEQPPSATEVRPWQLEREALRTKERFELDLVEQHKARLSAHTQETTLLAYISFSCFALMVVETAIDGGTLRALLSAHVSPIGYFLAALVGIPWFEYVWNHERDGDWIYYPPLAERNYAEWRERKDRHAAFLAESEKNEMR